MANVTEKDRERARAVVARLAGLSTGLADPAFIPIYEGIATALADQRERDAVIVEKYVPHGSYQALQTCIAAAIRRGEG